MRFVDEIASTKERSLPIQERFRRGDFIVAGGASSFIQQVWRFKEDIIFTARTGGMVLVYRYVGGNNVKDICYMAPEPDIAYVMKLHDGKLD
jgi:hypothetical protein